MSEKAFNGTVLEGRKRRYTVITEKDVDKYVPADLEEEFHLVHCRMAEYIEAGRIKDGKRPFNNYIVINIDEPYINEVIAIMQKHGHMLPDEVH